MDTRFSRLSTDPRFIKPKKQDKKVKIDERFTEMFSRDFNQESNLVDKRGKPIVSDESEKMARFYYNDSDDTKEDDEDQLTVGAKLARGITTLESSDEDEQEEIEVQEDSSTQEEILLGPETNRLALVNLDWDHISAKDIFKLFSSFSPDQITSTTIYISDFGKAQMEIESKSGPPSSIFNKSDKLIQSDSGSEFDQEELRKYQLSRLKYYYCVIECKTIEAAKKIYIECDDTEFESSSNLIDLRYIPNETVFSNQVFDFAENLDSEYTPKDFSTRALQHTRVALTWDNDDQDRIKITRRKFTQDELKDMDFKAFIASDEDSDVDVDKYRNLLSIEDNEQDMEITFTPGLTKSLETAISKKQEGIIEESVFDRERRERKEKKKAKKVVENDGILN